MYVCGGVNGGTVSAYLHMCKEMLKCIEKDEKNGAIPAVHDESYLNRYIIGRDDVKILDPGYCYPDFYNLGEHKKKIRLVWKQNYINIYALRGVKQTFSQKLYWWMRNMYHRILERMF